ncbi:glycerol-3-phosphate dehydrogenase/oxidase [Salinicola sp. JS01]|uniref:glycerol-3-phosphate dehydrogenase/oxidase n=1 Tax=Salinicola sp. JS01 TaxID=3050071 RepID=UPI00255BB822|nr:glycerol-3-phosphate dehydrogenase/oxidase [Salinicola sp. JS01]WIX33475.1 glycerol-3-phosphate dehydrogenase/oxidase [Salinicola sp. JS01]
MTPHHADTRQATRERLANDPNVEVLIIGAGINGAGLFRDLALQGIDVLIVDKQDFCAGASAAPSRLIHGGLKYLETGEFRLVAQSTRERNLLLRNAPHVVHPLRTAMPTHSWFGGIWPSLKRFLRRPAKIDDRGVLISEVGLTLYDFFGRHFRSMPRHSVLFGRRMRESLPDVRRDVKALHTYYDAAITQAERLGFELIDDGCRAHRGALALNYVALDSVTLDSATLDSVNLSSENVEPVAGQQSGLAGQGGTESATLRFSDAAGEAFEVRPRIVINAGGAWIDEINRLLGQETAYIGGTKGGHLIVDVPEIRRQLDGRMIYFGTPDGRICLIYPFMQHVLVGATDIRCDDPDQAVCDDDERDYMLEAVRYLFPDLDIGPERVRYRYSGVRPLPRSDADDPGQISRDHAVREDRLGEVPLLSLVGGKWTTFRGFAAEVADDVLARLGRRRDLSTEQLAIGGGHGYPQDEAARDLWLGRVAAACGGDRRRAITLLERYGSRGEAVAAHCEAIAEGQEPLASLPDYRAGEIDFVCRFERVERLGDVLFRRLPIALSARLTAAVVAEVATRCGAALGWSAAAREAEIARVHAIAWEHHGVNLGSPDAAESAACVSQTGSEVETGAESERGEAR